ncbi:hypothetical protein OAR04_00745 [Flavobacteriales bacterium]|nr:hypothetical protein [Flavobacteriales bacterium]
MDVEEILEMNSNSECRITITFREEWKNCYYQWKDESNFKLDANKLPLLDDEYIGDTGEPLYNDNDEEVFDPTKEIHYETFFEVNQYDIYSSKTFIGLLQKKVSELIESGELSEDSDSYEIKELLMEPASWGVDSMVVPEVGCEDLVHLKSVNEYDKILWCTSLQLDEEEISFNVEEI